MRSATRSSLLMGLAMTLVNCSTSPSPLPTPTPPTSLAPSPSASSSERYRSVEIASGLKHALAISPAPDGRIFFAEAKAGAIRVIDASGKLLPEPVATFEVSTAFEFGLVGLALDPAFSSNHRMYAYYTIPGTGKASGGSKVVRLVESGNKAIQDKVLLEGIPGAADKHVAGRMAVGPDGNLYIAVGDTQRPDQAQDPASLAGKILRITTDGDIPPDNPFPGSKAFAVGFRNPFGLAFDPASQRLFAVENGPASFDEVNVIEKGGNYGHPTIFGPSRGRFKDPIWDSGKDSHGMTGIAVVRTNKMARFTDRLLFCSFDNATLHSIPLLPDGSFGPDEPVSDVPCNLDVAVDNDGFIYVVNGVSIFRIEPAD